LVSKCKCSDRHRCVEGADLGPGAGYAAIKQAFDTRRRATAMRVILINPARPNLPRLACAILAT
jgi:hypothetical protein